MNKKGSVVGLVIFVAVLFLILIVGFLMSTGGAIVNWTADTILPELTNLGTTSGVNLTQAADLTIVPANNLLGNMGWFVGVLYVMMLLASIGFAVYARFNPDKWLLGFYFLLMILLIFGAVLVSNMYEDFYNTAGEFGAYLQAQTLMAFMIIQAPMIFALIGFITGIIIFSGMGQEVSA
ncbi:hypothetical protein HN698_07505 [Candidatus Woesearchaeota archaeon]|jgi:hypothetical protein|nr:hypothetical protein [Candidatus Woesearchaeota archaeon]